MPRNPPILDVRALSVVYGRAVAGRTALRDVSFSLERGESLGVIGETGAGKSTLARALLGLVPPASGSIRILDQEVSGFSSRRLAEFRRRGSVQYVFQDPLRSLDPDLTVGESIAEPLIIQGKRSPLEIERAVLQKLEQMQLDPSLRLRYPGEISGGQRQRVVMARALVLEPELLILDEPVSALDAANRALVLELLASLRASGIALLFISHDLGSVADVCDRILVLYRGERVETNTTRALLSEPRHPYTRLLVSSAPSMKRGALSRERRAELRAELEQFLEHGARPE